MTPEERKLLEDINKRLYKLEDLFYRFKQIDKYYFEHPVLFKQNSKIGFYGTSPVSQPATISDPSGGGTQDAEARTAINSLIDRLQELGLIAI